MRPGANRSSVSSRMLNVVVAIATASGALFTVTPPAPVQAAPVLGGQLYSTGEAVSVEVLPASAGLTSTLFLLEPEEVQIATNRQVGTVVNVGPYGAGEELIFGIRVSGQEYRMGPAERNPDGIIHATVDFGDDGCAVVGFEDLFGGGDRDYDDNRFRFCGGIAAEPPDPEEPPAPPFVGPNADAGDDQSVTEGNVVTLDATRSTASNLVTRTYTTTTDFAEGSSVNLSDVPPDQLQLDDTTEAFEFIWIAASARGTVVKIDTVTGEVLGEYWSAPQNRAKDPSRTTVDNNGNVWVGNRAETSTVGGVRKGSVTQIGLAENGQCVDRNGNGVIDTSAGLGNILTWPNASGVDTDGGVETAADECIINYVRTNGVAIRQVSVDAANHIWVGGAALGGSPVFLNRLAPDGSIVRTINMQSPTDTGETGAVRCCYGGLVDPNGILWSSGDTSNNLVRIDPSKPNGDPDLVRRIPLGRTSYGLGIDSDGFLWQTNWTANTVQKISPAGAILGTFPTGGPGNDRGVAVTADGDVWVANSGGNSVSRLRNDGSFVTTITVGTQPTGVAVDADGMVWASNLSSSTASRIDPATNTVDLTVNLGAGANPYNYSDMTGATLTGAPDTGTWTVVYDSESEDTAWAFADWTSDLPGDAAIEVSVASSANGVDFGPDVVVADGETFEGVADGRYLRVTTRFSRSSDGDSPVLFDLTVAHEGDRANTLAYQWRLVGIDGPPIFLSSATSPTPSFVAPDDASYTFELTVTDSAGQTDTDEVVVDVTNIDPTVEAEIGSAVARGVTLVSASFTDDGWLDTHAASFDWGDGTPADERGVTAQGTGWGTFFGSHVYAEAGSYPVTVTLTDDDGGTATVDLGQVAVGEPVAIWANSASAKKTFEWTGGGGSITGRVHSNNEVKVAGTQPKTIDGPTEYVKSIQVDGPHAVTPVQSTVQPIPLTYDLADYAPGGAVAIQVGAAYFDHGADCVGGTWDVGSTVLPVGVHYAPCAVKANGSSIGGQITLAATGAIELSGSNPAFEPYYDGLLLLSGASGKKAINVSASASKFLGVIYAASGEVSISGSDGRFFCGIYGDIVTVAGSNLTVRGANCGRPDSTVSGPLLVPGLELALAADPETTLPGGDIAYDLQVSNSGSLLVVPGLIGLENVDNVAATVTELEYALEYFSITDGAWVPIASLADDTIELTAHANAAPGVTYPASDAIVGTEVGPDGFATWGYQALVQLTPAQVELLLDETQVGGFRNRVDFSLDPASVQARRLFTFGTDFVEALRALSGDISDPQVTFLPPAGDLVTRNATTDPDLATLAPGESVALAEAFSVPVPAPRSATETDAGYLSRLLNLDGAALIGSSFALGQGGVGLLVAPLVSATTTEELPVVSLSALGPDALPAGASADYELKLANLGSADAPDLDVSATAADDDLLVAGAPASLVAGQLATATTSYSAPEENPPSAVTVTGTVAWSDAAGNAYGPVSSARTTQILTPALMTSTLVDALHTDVGADGQVSPGDTVRYTLTVTNHGGQALDSVVATVEPDVNSALVVGSTVAPDGTVVRGNSAGDSDVEVAVATLAGGSSVSFTFDAVVDDPFPTGVSRLEVQGDVTADAHDPIPTDDPARPGLADTTRTTVVVPVPNLTTFLSGVHHLDPDGNGFPSAGDTLRYSLEVNSVGSLPVGEIVAGVPVPAIASLVPGSVTTTQGTVTEGSGVSVDVGSLDPFQSATIGFDLLLADPLPTGTTAISVQGTVASAELDDLLTDDPSTFTVGDPTVIAVGSTSGGGGTPGVPGPDIGDVSPEEGATITEPTSISATLTPPAGETVTEWTVSYRLEGESDSVEIASGTGNTVEATLDPTVMPNGAYVVEISATGSAGGVSVAQTSVIVEGNLKLGRFSITVEDLAVGVDGLLPIRVQRTYDSFDKTVGDFGVGWRLEMANFRVSTNGPLGAGGWTMFQCGGGLIFVPLCFDSDRPHYVTVTWPDGRVETFDLSPAQGSSFLPGLTAAQFEGHPGTTSTLEALDSSLYYSNGDLLGGFFGSDGMYDPTRFRLTDQLGTEFVLEVGRGLLSARDRNGNTLTVTPNGVQSSLGPGVAFERDALGRIEAVIGPEGESIQYGYDATGDLVSVTDQTDNTTTLEYLPGHYLNRIVDPLGRPFQRLEYDDEGRLEAVVDSAGHRVEVETDVGGRQTVITDPSTGLVTVDTFDDRGNLLQSIQTFNGQAREWTFEYDDLDRPTVQQDPLQRRWVAAWNDKGNLTQITAPDGVVTTFTYNALGLPLSETTDGVLRRTYAYNDLGNLTRQVVGTSETLYEYTPSGLINAITFPGGRRVTLSHQNGLVIGASDVDGSSVSVVRDAAGRAIEARDPRNQLTTYEYDAAGRLTAVEDPTGQRQEYAYDALGRIEVTRDQRGETRTYTYDTAGRLHTITDRNDRLTTMGYDANSNLVSVAATSDTIEYGYDAVGRLIRAADGDSEIVYEYDLADGIVSQVTRGRGAASPPEVTIDWTYDEAGDLASQTTPAGTTEYGYDRFGRLDTLRLPQGGSIELSYDGQDRLLSVDLPNGVQELIDWDAAGNLDSRVATNADGDALVTSDYGYDSVGRRVTAATTSGLSAYEYDASGRLTEVTRGALVDAYDYDAGGNRTTAPGQSPVFGPGHRLETDGSFTYQYDDEGNLVRRTEAATGLITDYEWDGFNRLVRVVHPGGGETTYRFDAYGRRIEVNDRGAIERFVYDGANVALVFDGANVRTASYVSGEGPGEVYSITRGSDSYYHIHDGLNSTVALTDETGAVSEQLEYGAWGELQAAPVLDPIYTYAGLSYDAGSGWYYARARWYDASVGRFTGTDPLPCINPYPYASNDPINNADPLGEATLAEYGATNVNSTRQALVLKEAGFYLCGQLVNAAVMGLGQGRNAMGSMAENHVGDALGPGGRAQQPYPGASGRNRIADFFRGYDVIEVKNVQSQSLTSQIRDIIARAGKNGRPILVVRASTQLSGPLLNAFKAAGGSIIGCLPG